MIGTVGLAALPGCGEPAGGGGLWGFYRSQSRTVVRVVRQGAPSGPRTWPATICSSWTQVPSAWARGLRQVLRRYGATRIR